MRAGRKGMRARRRRLRLAVDDADGGPTAGPAQHERGGPVGAGQGHAVLLALLEAQAGLAAQGVAEGGAADAHRVEDGRLDDDVPGVARRPRWRPRP